MQGWGEWEISEKTPPASGIDRYDSHLRNSGRYDDTSARNPGGQPTGQLVADVTGLVHRSAAATRSAAPSGTALARRAGNELVLCWTPNRFRSPPRREQHSHVDRWGEEKAVGRETVAPLASTLRSRVAALVASVIIQYSPTAEVPGSITGISWVLGWEGEDNLYIVNVVDVAGEIPEKTRRPAVLSGTILTCENTGTTPPGIEPGCKKTQSIERGHEACLKNNMPRVREIKAKEDEESDWGGPGKKNSYHQLRVYHKPMPSHVHLFRTLYRPAASTKRYVAPGEHYLATGTCEVFLRAETRYLLRSMISRNAGRGRFHSSSCACEQLALFLLTYLPANTKAIENFKKRGERSVRSLRVSLGSSSKTGEHCSFLRWPPGVLTERLIEARYRRQDCTKFSDLRVEAMRELLRMCLSPLVLPRTCKILSTRRPTKGLKPPPPPPIKSAVTQRLGAVASQQGEPGSIPGERRSRISARGNYAGWCRWPVGFLDDIPFPPALSFRRCSILTSLHPHHVFSRLRHPDVRSRPDHSTQSPRHHRCLDGGGRFPSAPATE
ncbi:hypothetical protein PR048_015787 [Dryococelus australis]|uniref:Uncharacterized protein n=1 Tax=Dryococelus australis TaxID=614101 RepID=A0ABQ9HHX4_9NEOP|nr:hypothetical protein PR048_015787 [Dryococelus australis]